MNARLEQDLTQLDELLTAAQRFSAGLLSRVDELPASIAMPEQAEALLPEDGAGAIATLNRFREQYGPYLAAFFPTCKTDEPESVLTYPEDTASGSGNVDVERQRLSVQ